MSYPARAEGSVNRVCPKCIKTEALLTKTEMNNEGNINFLQNSPHTIQHTYFSKFSTDQSIFKILLVWREVVFLYYLPGFITIKINFQFRKTRKSCTESGLKFEYTMLHSWYILITACTDTNIENKVISNPIWKRMIILWGVHLNWTYFFLTLQI